MTQPGQRDLSEPYRVLEALIRSSVAPASALPGVAGEASELRTGPGAARRNGRPPRLVALEDELRRVHRTEQARLLVDAAELVLARPSRTAPDLLQPLPGIPDERRWRADANAELRLSEADRLDVPRVLREHVHRGARSDAASESRAILVELTSTALELRPGSRARLTLARVLVRVGRGREALSQLEAIDEERARCGGSAPPVWMPEWIDAETERCRAAAHERLGDLPRAGASLERIPVSAHGSVADAALALAIGLVSEDEQATRRACAAVGSHGSAVPSATQVLVRERLRAWHRCRRCPPWYSARFQSPASGARRSVAAGCRASPPAR